MFTDPQSVTINSVATTLPRVAMNGRSAVYESSDGGLTLTISHSNAKRTRSVVRLDRKKVGSDALNPSTNKQYTESVYLVVDAPLTGFSDDELKFDIIGLADLLKSANFVTKFLGQES